MIHHYHLLKCLYWSWFLSEINIILKTHFLYQQLTFPSALCWSGLAASRSTKRLGSTGLCEVLVLTSSELDSVWSESDWRRSIPTTLAVSSGSLLEEHSLVLVISGAALGDGDSVVSQSSPESSVHI